MLAAAAAGVKRAKRVQCASQHHFVASKGADLEHTSRRPHCPRSRPRRGAEAHRPEREGALRRRLGAPGPFQARSQLHHGRRAHRDVPDRSAARAPGTRAEQRRHQGRDRRDHHASGVLRRLARGHDRRHDRPENLRREEAMRIGFIGLGTMGRHMASNLMKGGYELVVNDVRREAAAPHLKAGATWADTPKAVAEASEIVFTSLPGPVEVEAVALGKQGLVRKIYEIYKQQGIHMLDAPVSGGPRGAESGRLALWVGGDEDVFKRHKPVLDAIGDQAYYVGPIGAGSVAKLVHNCAGYIVQTALAEVFTMGVKAGVEPIALWKAVRQGAGGRRRTFDGLADQFLPGKFDPPSFALRLAHKDVTLATALGREHKVPMKLANITLEEMTEALNRGWAERDSRVAMLLQEERAGVQIKVTEEAIREALAIDKTPPR